MRAWIFVLALTGLMAAGCGVGGGGESSGGIHCCNGTISHAQHRQGACSHHGGICEPDDEPSYGGGSGPDCGASYRPMRLERIEDGDTMVFFDGYAAVTCRVNGIDTPETFETQKLYETSRRCGVDVEDVRDAGEIAKAEAEILLSVGESYMVAVVDTDQYSRKVCKISMGGADFGETMVEGGFAVVLEQYLCDIDRNGYLTIERIARDGGRGLWSQYYGLMACLTNM